MAGHDTIVIGGSAGALAPLDKLFGDLPASLNAAIFVVIHTSPDSVGAFPQILARSGQLLVEEAQDGLPISQSRAYIAPPNFHLIIDEKTMSLCVDREKMASALRSIHCFIARRGRAGIA